MTESARTSSPQDFSITLKNVSVVIPVGPHDNAWKELIEDLINLPLKTEILFVGSHFAPESVSLISETLALGRSVRWITAKQGRAEQMNAGAEKATGDFVWFLHSDSRFTLQTLMGLEVSLQKNPDLIHYFKLRFSGTSPLTRLNDLGVLIRSRYFKMPFGDQGLCMKKSVFRELGGFPLGTAYGEDHLLIWNAHQRGIALSEIQACLLTSPRKYEKGGWLKTTSRHLWLTYKQAAPELVKLLKKQSPR